MIKEIEQFSVLGFPVNVSDDYSQWLISRVNQKMGSHVVTLNAEMVIQADSNPDLGNIIKNAELVVPDGSGVVLYLRLSGKKQKRCPGIELAELLLGQAAQLGDSCPVLFFGGAPGVAEKAAENMIASKQNLKIVATQHGYLSQEEQVAFLETIKEKQPKLILVGLGVPRQELWIAEHRYLAPESIWIGVGGSFDIWAGIKSRAPGWLADNHLEWLYRLYQEPWRWRRMMALPQFALRSFGELGLSSLQRFQFKGSKS